MGKPCGAQVRDEGVTKVQVGHHGGTGAIGARVESQLNLRLGRLTPTARLIMKNTLPRHL